MICKWTSQEAWGFTKLLQNYMKEELKMRDPKSSLPELEDMPFLRDLEMVKEDGSIDRLTVAGLLFVGKGTEINRLLS